jgi:hypothetical protein
MWLQREHVNLSFWSKTWTTPSKEIEKEKKSKQEIDNRKNPAIKIQPTHPINLSFHFQGSQSFLTRKSFSCQLTPQEKAPLHPSLCWP